MKNPGKSFQDTKNKPIKTSKMNTETETNELTVFVEQSGIEKSKGNEITENLNVFFNKAKEWDATIQSIVINDVSEVGKMKMAREGRLTLKKLRVDSDKVVKAKRDEIKYRMANDILEDKLWLKAGQMVEAVYKNLETKLEEKEKFAERKEQERKEKIKAERIAKLAEYPEFDATYTDLLNIPDSSFDQLISGLQTAKEKRIADEKAAEEARVQKEHEEADERERIRVENERLKKEAEEKAVEEARIEGEKKDAIIARRNTALVFLKKEGFVADEFGMKAKDYQHFIGSDHYSQFETDAELESFQVTVTKTKEMELQKAKAEADRKAAQKIADDLAKLAAEKLRIEKEKSDKLQAEIKAKQDAELKAKKDAETKAANEEKARLLAEKKSKSAPDKAKLESIASNIDDMVFPELKSQEANEILKSTIILLAKTSKYIREKTAEL